MRKYLALFLAAFVFFSGGCTVKNGGAPTQMQVEAKRDQLTELSSSKTVSIVGQPYLGAKPIVRESGEEIPVLGKNVTLKQEGTLSEIAASLCTIAPLSAQVVEADGEDVQPAKPAASEPPLDDLGLPSLTTSHGGAGQLAVSYTGSLRGLLDTIASLSGYGWDYDAKTNRVTFSATQVRTFTILSAPGLVSYDSQISNKSRERTSGNSISASGVNSTVTSGNMGSQTSQTLKNKLEYDVWREIENGVKALLSKRGTVSVNQGAGTITVRDSFSRLQDIAAYISALNARLARQVAITIRIWALEVSDTSEGGVNLQALFENNNVSVVAGSLTDLGSTSSAAVSIVHGKLKGSSGTVRAMKEWGKATQLTSGGGLMMNNQPLSVHATTSRSYPAGMSLSTSDYNQTSEITPGEVVVGAVVTIIPHILDNRRVILQCNSTLSSLGSGLVN
ncbi:pilus assembly protein [Bilophila wadsworthia]|uniref:pilus assembly protein n=1 Tax=Bilophila wadsworthia TaxID=35833 RepID=UPI001DF038E1|nr:pilus assembly protein [Bilophila wadsworthia]MBS5376817.1 pilus assembly protein [Bilophila wadsworthia]